MIGKGAEYWNEALPSEYLHRRLLADFDAGVAVWRYCEDMSNSWNSRFACMPAFRGIGSNGYRRGKIDGFTVMLHRVLFSMEFGIWPSGQIDHMDRDMLNNSLYNLREVSFGDNQRNRAFRSNFGVVGVYLENGRYRARFWLNGKWRDLGLFPHLEQAQYRLELMRKEHGVSEFYEEIEPLCPKEREAREAAALERLRAKALAEVPKPGDLFAWAAAL